MRRDRISGFAGVVKKKGDYYTGRLWGLPVVARFDDDWKTLSVKTRQGKFWDLVALLNHRVGENDEYWQEKDWIGVGCDFGFWLNLYAKKKGNKILFTYTIKLDRVGDIEDVVILLKTKEYYFSDYLTEEIRNALDRRVNHAT